MNIRKIHAVDYNDCAKNLVAAYAGPPWNNKWTENEALLRIEATMSGFNSRGYVVEEKGKIIAMCLGRIQCNTFPTKIGYWETINKLCLRCNETGKYKYYFLNYRWRTIVKIL